MFVLIIIVHFIPKLVENKKEVNQSGKSTRMNYQILTMKGQKWVVAFRKNYKWKNVEKCFNNDTINLASTQNFNAYV